MSDLINEAAKAIAKAEFRVVWPVKVRQILVQAANGVSQTVVKIAKDETQLHIHGSNGEVLPESAIRWALGQARHTEQRMKKSLAEGMAFAPRKPIPAMAGIR